MLAKDLIVAQRIADHLESLYTRRRVIASASIVNVDVEDEDLDLYDRVEIALDDTVRAALMAKTEAEIAQFEARMREMGVTGLDALDQPDEAEETCGEISATTGRFNTARGLHALTTEPAE